MARLRQEGLTAREMELIQVLWQEKEATVKMIQAKLFDQLEGSTIRTLLQIMEDKGYVAHEKQGRANYATNVFGSNQNRDCLLSMLVCTSINTVFPSAFNRCASCSAGRISPGFFTMMPTAPMPSAIWA